MQTDACGDRAVCGATIESIAGGDDPGVTGHTVGWAREAYYREAVCKQLYRRVEENRKVPN